MEASLVAVLKALAYEDIFDYPLTTGEIYRFQPERESRVKIKAALGQLVKTGQIGQKEGFFFLKGREKTVALRKKKAGWAKEKRALAKKAGRKLGGFPFVSLVGLTGALAMENSRKNDDIDLLIITWPGFLWLGRLIILLSTPLLGIKRRRPKEKAVKNKICFNLFLEEGSLKVGPPSLFLAHEVVQLKPLVNKGRIYEKFLGENQWVGDFLPNAIEKLRNRDIKNIKEIKRSRNSLITQLLNILISWFNWLAFLGQYFYMKPKMTVEKVSLHQAFFHPRSLQDRILGRYKEKLKSYE
jgi:hypothetical protein